MEYNPEPVEQLQQRVPAALEPVFKCEGRPLSDKQVKTHTFDFEDGVRLIMTKIDLELGGEILLMVSMSFFSCGSIRVQDHINRLINEYESRPDATKCIYLTQYKVLRLLVGQGIIIDKTVNFVVTPKGVPTCFFTLEAGDVEFYKGVPVMAKRSFKS